MPMCPADLTSWNLAVMMSAADVMSRDLVVMMSSTYVTSWDLDVIWLCVILICYSWMLL